MTDRELLERIAAKDDNAFRVLYERYERLFYNWALSRLGDYDIACEVAQNFWISVWTSPTDIRTNDGGSAKDYLLRRLTFRILKQLQREMNRMEIPDEALIEQRLPDLTYTHVNEALDMKEVLLFIDEILKKLPPLPRRIYRLRYIDNRSVTETATVLSVSEKTVRNGLSSALSTLRRELTLHYETSGPDKLRALLPFLLFLLGE
jgi:RNA polymerase sigma factor (sigma-70 family)